MRSFKKLGAAVALAMSLALVTPVVIPANTITADAASIKMNYMKKTLKVGKTLKLKVTGIGKKKVTWTSSKKTVASVSKTGKVTAKKSGTATITAKIGKTKKTCKITVEKVNPNIAEAPFKAEEIKVQNTPYSIAAPKGWFSTQSQVQAGYQLLQVAPQKGDGKSVNSRISLSLVKQSNLNGTPDYESVAKPYFESAVTEEAIKTQLTSQGITDIKIVNFKQEDLKSSLGTVFKVTMAATYKLGSTEYAENMSFYYIFVDDYLLQAGIDEFTTSSNVPTPSLTDAAEYMINSLYKIQ